MKALLELLPEQDEEGDGWYFELRKFAANDWACVKTNLRTMKDACSNVGHTPEEAVRKMLDRLKIKRPAIVGDWVYCKKLDQDFKVLAIDDYMLQESDVLWIHKDGCEVVDIDTCPRCRAEVPVGQVRERHSFSVYAGKFCDKCCSSYRDNCGLDGCQGDPQELDEVVEPEDYY